MGGGNCDSAYRRCLSALKRVRAHKARPTGLFLLVGIDLRRFPQLHHIWFALRLQLLRRLHLRASDNRVGIKVVRRARWPEARH